MTEDHAQGSLSDLVGFVWRHRKLIVGLVGVCCVVSVIAALVMPVKYTARTTLLPKKEAGSGLLSAALSMVGGGAGLSIPGLAGESAVQEAVLRSDRLAWLIDDEFQLSAEWKTRNREAFLRGWQASLITDTNRDGLLTVGFKDRDPERAAQIVTRLVAHLDTYNREFRSTTGRRTREFLESRLQETEQRMRALEDSLTAYQAAHAGVSMSTDPNVMMSASATVLSSRLTLRAEAEVLRRTLGSDAPALRAKEMEIAALDQELAKLPDLNARMGRLLRSLQVIEQAFVFLSAQLEDARVEEARDTPTVDILDPARVPEEKSWPPRTMLVLGTALLSFVFALMLAALSDAFREARRREALNG